MPGTADLMPPVWGMVMDTAVVVGSTWPEHKVERNFSETRLDYSLYLLDDSE